MLRAKKYFLSFLFLSSLAVLQFNMFPAVKPVSADDTLLSNQALLKDSTANNYGSNPKDIKIIALDMLKVVLQFIAIVFVILIIVAGFKYMTSQGNETKTKDAMNQIKALAIGLLIILASWGITKYILNLLVCTTSSSNVSCTGKFW